ncbi:uncharacterized protein CEXT_524691 [Caerostris extrusa]|uniref:Uncharacterized protein n=1 Tax=Caerostris extrusa TaxID=172846 RepID=A0AAV4TKG6_CAEEX|nr:uncharacterized protein CEXT_524691 [Caerostris extrusa]
MDKDKNESPLRSSCLTVTRSSIKSRSSNCLMDPAITPWLPGLSLTAPSTTNEWTNFKFDSPDRRERTAHRSPTATLVQTNSGRQRGCLPTNNDSKVPGGRGGLARTREKNLSSLEKGKDDDQLSPLGRKVIVFVAVFLFLLCILLVGVTLRLGPVIDEMGKRRPFSSLYCLKKFFVCV